MDRTAAFLRLAKQSQESSPHPARPRARPRRGDFFHSQEALTADLDAVAGRVALFAREAQQDAGSLFGSSGGVLQAGVEQIKQSLERLKDGMGALKKRCRTGVGVQLRQHRQLVVDALEARLAALVKEFSSTLQRRTTAVSSRQARQARQFGAAKVQVFRNAPSFSTEFATQPGAVGRGSLGDGLPRPGTATQNASFMTPRNVPTGMQPPSAGNGIQAPTMGGGVRRRGNKAAAAEGGGRGLSNYYAANSLTGAAGAGFHNDGINGKMQHSYMHDSSFQNRAREVQQAESTIVELGQMFSKIATLVAEQGEQVQRIDEDMDEGSLHVRKGHSELLKLFNSVQGERALIFKIFGVLLIGSILFMMFLR